MSRKKFLTLPNALTVLAILCGPAALWFGNWRDDLGMTLLFLIIGGALCVIDGMVAERWDMRSAFGDEPLQPIAGASLAIAALAVLKWHGYWSWWAIGVIAGVAIGLQAIDFVNNMITELPRLKRFQFAAHPLFSIAVSWVATTWIAWQVGSLDHVLVLCLAVVLPILLGLIRRYRLLYWLAGPPSRD